MSAGGTYGHKHLLYVMPTAVIFLTPATESPRVVMELAAD